MKIRGTTVTTPLPKLDAVLFTPQELTLEQQEQARENIGVEKEVYTIYYHEGYGWGIDGLDYDAVLRAFRAGKIVILFYERIAMCGSERYVCTKEIDEGDYYGYGLEFIGASCGNIQILRLLPDGTVYLNTPTDVEDLRTGQDMLESRISHLPFKAITGTTSIPVVIRNLESGVYLLNGKVKNISTASTSNAVNDFYLVSNNGAKSYVIKFATSLHAVHQYILTDTTTTFNQCRLDLILDRLDSVEARLAALGG